MEPMHEPDASQLAGSSLSHGGGKTSGQLHVDARLLVSYSCPSLLRKVSSHEALDLEEHLFQKHCNGFRV